MGQRNWLAPVLALTTFSVLVSNRVYLEKGTDVRAGVSKKFVGSTFDLRGQESVDRVARLRESEAFKAQLKKGLSQRVIWPGLKAAQLSWNWLELLQGVHIKSSHEGDFSWMFSKLYFVSQYSSEKEVFFLSTLAPFYFVMSTDFVGASIFVQELTRKVKNNAQVWFWAGYHAMENLKDNKLAGEYMRQAALRPGAPFYVAALSVRLRKGEAFLSKNDLGEILEKELEPELLKQVKKSRPEWFSR